MICTLLSKAWLVKIKILKVAKFEIVQRLLNNCCLVGIWCFSSPHSFIDVIM